MKRDVRPRLVDILEAIDGINRAVGDASLLDYRQNRTLRRAVERELEIISEASRHLPAELKAEEPDVPWREIAGIGNVLRHDYQRVADAIVWNVVQIHLDPPRRAVVRLVERTEMEDGG